MAMMCYRYAMKSTAPHDLYQNWEPRSPFHSRTQRAQSNHWTSFVSPTRQRLLSKCLQLLAELSVEAGRVGGDENNVNPAHSTQGTGAGRRVAPSLFPVEVSKYVKFI